MKNMDADLGDLTNVNRRAAEVVLPAARARIRNRTGTLAASGRVTASRTRSAVVFGGRAVPYAGPIHFGWPAHNIEANPFAWEGADDRKGQVAELYEREIDGLVMKLDRQTP